MERKLGLRFVQHGEGDLRATLGPEDVFNYLYAIFYSPTYRERYAEFLQRDFPRVPVTSDVSLFRSLCNLGGRLVGLHLLRQIDSSIAVYPISGDNRVEVVRYTPPTDQRQGCVWINKTQYFEGVTPEVWRFHVGGYQVAEKWLKDRKGRKLDYEDLNHYIAIIDVLVGTMRLMEEIDSTIPSWPLV